VAAGEATRNRDAQARAGVTHAGLRRANWTEGPANSMGQWLE
jgi:hypothetical protein